MEVLRLLWDGQSYFRLMSTELHIPACRIAAISSSVGVMTCMQAWLAYAGCGMKTVTKSCKCTISPNGTNRKIEVRFWLFALSVRNSQEDRHRNNQCFEISRLCYLVEWSSVHTLQSICHYEPCIYVRFGIFEDESWVCGQSWLTGWPLLHHQRRLKYDTRRFTTGNSDTILI